MVTIGGQCALLQNSLKIMVIYFKEKLLYESHLSRHTSEPMKNVVKAKQQKCPKMDSIL